MTKRSYELKPVKAAATFDAEHQTSGGLDERKLESQDGESGERGQWSRGLEFLFSCISLSVGLGNVWRFPNVAYANGGGAFLIPYLLLLFVVGRPLYYLEFVLGQFSGKGPINVWKCVPALKGIGFAQLASTSYLIIFYNYLMALTVYYLFASFQNPLPWSWCDPEWATNCAHANESVSLAIGNASESGGEAHVQSLTEQYWNNHVLRASSGLAEVTYINWRLTLCLALSWLAVYLSIARGVQSLGKVVYFTGIFPYLVLIGLLVAALTTEGALDGIVYFFRPQWHRLWDPIVWYRAVEQSFFSLGVCFGSLTMYSSYNNFKNNVYRDAIIISVLDTFTSILAGCVIFAVLGSMAFKRGVSIEDVVDKQGLGLAFVAYPEALSQFETLPQLWSILFFVMLFTLGLGSSVAQIETILTCVRDEYTGLMERKSLLAFGTCVFFCICGIPLTTNAGIYMMKLLDNYGVGTAVFLYGIAQVTGVMWIYGLGQFCADIKFMLGRPVGFFWRITWGLVAPLTLIAIFVYGNYQLFAEGGESDPGIPDWGYGIGWALAAIAIFQIPLWIAITIHRNSGSFRQKLVKSFSPAPDWGPSDAHYFQDWLAYNISRKEQPPPKYHLNDAFNPHE